MKTKNLLLKKLTNALKMTRKIPKTMVTCLFVSAFLYTYIRQVPQRTGGTNRVANKRKVAAVEVVVNKRT